MTDRKEPGQRLRKINATGWNNAFEAGDFYARNKRLSDEGPGRDHLVLAERCRLRNDSGADRDAGDVLEIGDLLVDPIDAANLWFEGETPAVEGRGFAVLRRPTPEDEIDEAIVSGVCACLVDVVDTSHKFARLVDGSHFLESSDFGDARLLNTPATASKVLCGVLLGTVNQRGRVGKPTGGGITAASGATFGTGTVTFQQAGATALAAEDEGTTSQAVKSFIDAAIPTSAYCWVEPDWRGDWWVTAAGCP